MLTLHRCLYEPENVHVSTLYLDLMEMIPLY